MVSTLETLHALDGTRHGPVSFEAAEAGIAATFDGDTAMVAVDGGTFRIRVSAPCSWPEGADAVVTRRVRGALSDLAAARPDLCLLRAQPSGVVAELWLDGGCLPFEIAGGVRTAVLLARVGVAVLDDLVREAASEAFLLTAQSQAERAADEAERALQRLLATGAPDSVPREPADAPPARPADAHPVRPAAAPPARPADARQEGARGAPPRSWCVTDLPTEIHGLTAASGMIGTTQPGTRYEVVAEHPGWVRIRGGGVDGWVPTGAVQRMVGREALAQREEQGGGAA